MAGCGLPLQLLTVPSCPDISSLPAYLPSSQLENAGLGALFNAILN